MNIYDFDNTIYDGDTNKDIIIFGLKKYPFKVIFSLLKANSLNKKYKKGEIEFERVKEAMLSFLFKIKKRDKFISSFVEKNIKKIKPWYLKQKTDNDIIISASYELWIVPFCEKIGIKYIIGTKTDDYGKIIGKNCKSEEKLRRLVSVIPNAFIKNAYSDAKADEPMLKVAQNGYVVEGNNIYNYVENYKFKNIN